jgi:hypothetical protein
LPFFLTIEASSKQSALLAPCFLVVSSLVYSPILKIETVYSSEASLNFYQSTRRQIPEDSPTFLTARNICVGIATGYGLDDRGARSSSPGRVKNFLFSKSFRPALRSTQPPIQWEPRVLSPGVKRPGREADHVSPTSVEVKIMWIYTFPPSYAFMA